MAKFNRKSLGLDETAIERILWNAFPIGSFMWWFGKQSKIPSGWIICDGRSITTYPDLVEVLGKNVAPNLVGTYTYIKGSTTPMVYQNAGIPNIYGAVSGAAVSTRIVTDSPGGSFFDTGTAAFRVLNTSSIDPAISVQGLNSQASRGYNDFDFHASKGQVWIDGSGRTNNTLDESDSRVVYGKSNTVTPPNISAIPIIKAKSH